MTELSYENPKLVVETAKMEPGQIHWRSPSNLALIKYWGKRAVQIPQNPSISFTLSSAFTETILEYGPKQNKDEEIDLKFSFQGEENPAFADRTKNYLTSLLEIFPFLRQLELTIRSGNSFPHSSGIASSASSMSALALCLCSLEDNLFQTLDDDNAFDRKASYLARLGSGSACRSIFPTMAVWGEFGEVEGSSDLYAVPYSESVHQDFHSFHDDILIVSREQKKVSSSAGHGLMDQNSYADPRYQQARQRMHSLLLAMRQGDMEVFGRIVENEALTLHALMMTSNPSYILMRPNSLEMIERIRNYRAETNHPVYFSLDAGPNIHVLYPESIIHEVRPFIEEQLVPLCEDQFWLADWVGEGPEQV
jgi:diphosphomevalonate decarboxylase